MSNCRETEPVFICFTPTDTNIAPVTLLQHVVYEEGRAIGHVITTPTDMLTEIDPAAHLGGGAIVAGACAIPETPCPLAGPQGLITDWAVLIGA